MIREGVHAEDDKEETTPVAVVVGHPIQHHELEDPVVKDEDRLGTTAAWGAS